LGLDVTIVVPCFDEAQRLRLDAFRSFLAASHRHRLLFVDDGSRDDTLAMLRQFVVEGDGRVDVLALERNHGKAEAVRRGVLQALEGEAHAVGYWDADLATPLSEVDLMAQLLAEQPQIQIVLGSRVKLLGKRIERHEHRHYFGRVFATGASLVLSLPVYDTQCGAKLFRAHELTRRLFAEPFVARWTFDVELLARYRFREAQGAEGLWEHPVSRWTDVAGSKVRFWDAGVAFWELWRILWRYRLGSRRSETKQRG
jgi:glycosyltransferase involved in cell wall biosynthesis